MRSRRKYNSLPERRKPRPSAFKQFVTRSAGASTAPTRENGSRSALPRVSFWSLWNEPHQAGWPAPQWGHKGGSSCPPRRRFTGSSSSAATRPWSPAATASTTHHPDGRDGAQSHRSAHREGAERPGRSCASSPTSIPRQPVHRRGGERSRLRRLRRPGRTRPTASPITRTRRTSRRRPPTPTPTRSDGEHRLAGRAARRGCWRRPAARSPQPAAVHYGVRLRTNPPDPFNGVAPAQQELFKTTASTRPGRTQHRSQAQFLLRDVGRVRSHKKRAPRRTGSPISGRLSPQGPGEAGALSLRDAVPRVQHRRARPNHRDRDLHPLGSVPGAPQRNGGLGHDPVAREPPLARLDGRRRPGASRPDGLLPGRPAPHCRSRPMALGPGEPATARSSP